MGLMSWVGDCFSVFDRFFDWTRQPKSPARIARRLQKVCNLLMKSDHRPFTHAMMAESMGLPNVGGFEAHLSGKEEADFAWIGKFCATFGSSPAWIKSGLDAPFTTSLQSQGAPSNYRELIDSTAPDEIFFVRSSGPIGEFTMVFGWSELRYCVAKDYWHLSSHVGSGGARDILEFYRFLKGMEPTFLELRPCGRIVSSKEFHLLVEGKVYPRAVLNGRDAPWWDDFMDIDHSWPIATNYETLWGREFIYAQQIVRNLLKKDNEQQLR